MPGYPGDELPDNSTLPHFSGIGGSFGFFDGSVSIKLPAALALRA
jgi:hypothetical protein